MKIAHHNDGKEKWQSYTCYLFNEAFDKAKEAGWVHYVDGNKDYCPECAKNVSD